MTQIRIKNQIKMTDQQEEITEKANGQVIRKSDSYYLTYQNDNQEKVVLKVNSMGLVMSRFSEPKSIMRFYPQEDTQSLIATPLGMRGLTIETRLFFFDECAKEVKVSYRLYLDPEKSQSLADYDLTIGWD